MIGLCHAFAPRKLCQIIGVPPEEIEWQATGLNKSVYLTRLRRDGRDLYPRIDEWIANKAPEYWRTLRERAHRLDDAGEGGVDADDVGDGLFHGRMFAHRGRLTPREPRRRGAEPPPVARP